LLFCCHQDCLRLQASSRICFCQCQSRRFGFHQVNLLVCEHYWRQLLQLASQEPTDEQLLLSFEAWLQYFPPRMLNSPFNEINHTNQLAATVLRSKVKILSGLHLELWKRVLKLGFECLQEVLQAACYCCQ